MDQVHRDGRDRNLAGDLDVKDLRYQRFVTREEVVRPVGFEPTAFCSGGKRSIQAELRARNVGVH